MSFQALMLRRPETGFAAAFESIDDAQLAAGAEGDVVVAISHSTINYKDALAVLDRSPVVRRWPMVPGIDGAGVVEQSSDARFKPGDAVLVDGWGLGETHWGCWAAKARLKADWLQPIPAGLDARSAMAIGTAGYTAMLCVMALEEAGIGPGDGEVLVTGATGGVGSVAIALLAARGHAVVASTGKADEAGYLHALGAREVVDRATLSQPSNRPLQKERWAGVVDAVGSHTLANALAQTRYGGAVAACGLAQGMDLPTSVAPFILRGVRLLGVDSVMCPMPRRVAAWDRLARDLDRAKLASITQEVSWKNAVEAARGVLAGAVRGRTVVTID